MNLLSLREKEFVFVPLFDFCLTVWVNPSKAKSLPIQKGKGKSLKDISRYEL